MPRRDARRRGERSSVAESNPCDEASPRPDSVPPMTARADDDQLVWLDLEMTGLDVERHTIVEIACIVTDSQLTLLDEGIDIVIHQDAETLARMDDFVRKMHTKSGLLPAILASGVQLGTAQARTLEYLKSHVPLAGAAPFC